ncbi:hypothetical protein ColKHC_04958 [Colletotrichum higginsianum]|nr:hypothetical protein ColKHC_04958 [Colletotrichum higginsianum]
MRRRHRVDDADQLDVGHAKVRHGHRGPDQHELLARHLGQDILEAGGGHVGVERQIGEVGLEDGEKGDDGLARSRGQHPDEGAGGEPTLAQPGRKLIRPFVEFSVGQPRRCILDGNGVGVGRGLLDEEIHDTGVPGVFGRGGLQQAEIAQGRQSIGQRQARQRDLRLFETPTQDLLEHINHGPHRLLLEEVRRVEDVAPEPALLLEEVELEIEPRRRGEGQRRPREALELDFPDILLRVDGEDDLYQRVARGIPGPGQQGGHNALKGNVLVLERGRDCRANLADQPVERLGIIHGNPHTLRVHEETDEVFQLRPASVGNRGADSRIIVTSQPVMRSAERGEQDGKGRGLVGAAEPLEVFIHGALDGQLDEAAVARDGGRPRLVAQQRRGLAAGQLALPVVQLPLVLGDLGVLLLPGGEVAVLDRQRGDGGLLAAQGGGVEEGQLALEDVKGPPVGDDVVHDDGEDVIFGPEAQQDDAPARFRREVEGLGLLVLEDVFVPAVGHLDDTEVTVRVARRLHDLHADAVVLLERRPQRLVASDECGQGGPERVRVKRAGHSDGDRHVVAGGVAEAELVEEPETPLAEGLLDRAGVRVRGDLVVLLGALLDGGGEVREDRPVEDILDRNPRLEPPGQTGRQLRCHERVAAQVEEVVRHADLHAEDVGEFLAEDAFHLGTRGDVGRGFAGPRHHRLGPQREPDSVNLSVGVDRELIEHRDLARDHVRRQQRLEVLADLGLDPAALLAVQRPAGHETEGPGLRQLVRRELHQHAAVVVTRLEAVEHGVDGAVLRALPRAAELDAEPGLPGQLDEVEGREARRLGGGLAHARDPGRAVQGSGHVGLVQGLDEQPFDDGAAVGDVAHGDGLRIGGPLQQAEQAAAVELGHLEVEPGIRVDDVYGLLRFTARWPSSHVDDGLVAVRAELVGGPHALREDLDVPDSIGELARQPGEEGRVHEKLLLAVLELGDLAPDLGSGGRRPEGPERPGGQEVAVDGPGPHVAEHKTLHTRDPSKTVDDLQEVLDGREVLSHGVGHHEIGPEPVEAGHVRCGADVDLGFSGHRGDGLDLALDERNG